MRRWCNGRLTSCLGGCGESEGQRGPAGGIGKRKRDLIKVTDMSERIASCGSLDNASLLLQYCNGELSLDFPVNTGTERGYRNGINANDLCRPYQLSC